MNINAISYQPANKNSQPTFGIWNREVYKNAEGKVFNIELAHRNTTYLFRNHSFWQPFVMFIGSIFKDTPHVNVYDYGCSNGSEAYTFIISLLSNLKPDIANKFFPVIAKDYDEFAVETAKKGIIPVSPSEIYYTNSNSKYSFRDFFEERTDILSNGPVYSPKKELSDKVRFEVGDICKDYKNIKPDNSIIFARNFWPYLGKLNSEKLADDLYNTVNKNSYLVLGKFDLERSETAQTLKSAGFKCVLPQYVFSK